MARKKTIEQYVAEVRAVHGDTYGYDRLVYSGASKPIIITCKVHGDVKSNSTSHLAGAGCFKCSHATGASKRVKPAELFFKAANDRHNGKYSYDKAVYVNNSTAITITCDIHGDFEARPDSHKRGSGCTGCAGYGYQKTKPGNFYVLTNGVLTKVGITNRSVKTRLNKLNQAGLGLKVEWTSSSPCGGEIFKLEQRVKQWLKLNYERADDKFDGYTETFKEVDMNRLMECIVQERDVNVD